MIFETIGLWDGHPEAKLTAYTADMTSELNLSPRSAVIVCPGGGYHFLSSREAEPIAFRFLAEGMNAFILTYGVGEKAQGGAPLIEAALAIKYVRENAEKYNTDPKRIFICGFSAGGHLAAWSGTDWNTPEVRNAVGVSSGSSPERINRPDGMILCYPVIDAGEYAHRGSIRNLSGHEMPTEEDVLKYSVDRHVDENTCPAFIWHTFSDGTVPIMNSIMMQTALAKAGIPFESHIFPEGGHGLSLCNEFTSTGREGLLNPHCEIWMDLAVKWIKSF